jgi:hypothetical protein
MIGPNVFLLLSAGTSTKLLNKAKTLIKAASYVGSLKNGIPDSIRKGDVVVFVSPSSSQDYLIASKIASDKVASSVILVNGLAKVRE